MEWRKILLTARIEDKGKKTVVLIPKVTKWPPFAYKGPGSPLRLDAEKTQEAVHGAQAPTCQMP